MALLFGYILTILVFLGGGYAGLTFVAGGFDSPRNDVHTLSGVPTDQRLSQRRKPSREREWHRPQRRK